MIIYKGLIVFSLFLTISTFSLAQDCIVNQETHPFTNNLCLAMGPKPIRGYYMKIYHDYIDSQYWLELEVLTVNYFRIRPGHKVNFSFKDGTSFSLINIGTIEPKVKVQNK
jgi:hypothetical protein